MPDRSAATSSAAPASVRRASSCTAGSPPPRRRVPSRTPTAAPLACPRRVRPVVLSLPTASMSSSSTRPQAVAVAAASSRAASGRSAADAPPLRPPAGFGLFGTPVWGTRYGSTQPLQKIENVRPLCMDFFKSGFCNRKGPHNQGCLFRHDEIEGKGKIEAPPGADAAPRPLAPADGPGAACRCRAPLTRSRRGRWTGSGSRRRGGCAPPAPAPPRCRS